MEDGQAQPSPGVRRALGQMRDAGEHLSATRQSSRAEPPAGLFGAQPFLEEPVAHPSCDRSPVCPLQGGPVRARWPGAAAHPETPAGCTQHGLHQPICSHPALGLQTAEVGLLWPARTGGPAFSSQEAGGLVPAVTQRPQAAWGPIWVQPPTGPTRPPQQAGLVCGRWPGDHAPHQTPPSCRLVPLLTSVHP